MVVNIVEYFIKLLCSQLWLFTHKDLLCQGLPILHDPTIKNIKPHALPAATDLVFHSALFVRSRIINAPVRCNQKWAFKYCFSKVFFPEENWLAVIVSPLPHSVCQITPTPLLITKTIIPSFLHNLQGFLIIFQSARKEVLWQTKWLNLEQWKVITGKKNSASSSYKYMHSKKKFYSWVWIYFTRHIWISDYL